MPVQPTHQNPPAREQDIAGCEQALGVTLPAWLRSRLTTENGWAVDDRNGVTGKSWLFLPVLDRSDRKRLSKTAEDIAWHTQKARQGGFPDGGVVVARTPVTDQDRLILLPEKMGELGHMLHRQYSQGAVKGDPINPDTLGRRREPKSDLGPGPFPVFTYHPDPVATGAFVASDDVCPCCERQTGWAYTMEPYAVANVAYMCPWCIADGSAASKFDAEFVPVAPWVVDPETGDAIPKITQDVLVHRTPSFASMQEEEWQVCCDDACAFLGVADADQVAMLDAVIRAEYHLDDGYIAYLRSMDPADLRNHADPAVFLFQCLHCATIKVWVDVS